MDSSSPNWLPISLAPFDVDLEVCVIESDGVHALVVPCRRSRSGWVSASTAARLDIQPTHWRSWVKNRQRER